MCSLVLSLSLPPLSLSLCAFPSWLAKQCLFGGTVDVLRQWHVTIPRPNLSVPKWSLPNALDSCLPVWRIHTKTGGNHSVSVGKQTRTTVTRRPRHIPGEGHANELSKRTVLFRRAREWEKGKEKKNSKKRWKRSALEPATRINKSCEPKG